MIQEENDYDSTVIRHGLRAMTFSDMAGFAELVEQRTLDRLLVDIHGFALLSEAKFNLARQIVRRRLRALPEVEREQFRVYACEACEDDPGALERVAKIFAID
jgi:hypothetical protein